MKFINPVSIGIVCATIVIPYTSFALEKSPKVAVVKTSLRREVARTCSRLITYQSLGDLRSQEKRNKVNRRFLKKYGLSCSDLTMKESVQFLRLDKIRDEAREASLNYILDAIFEFIRINGYIPRSITDQKTEICRTDAKNCKNLIDLSIMTGSVFDPKTIIESLPVDPKFVSENSTGYSIQKNVQGKITVSAPHTESSATPISITR